MHGKGGYIYRAFEYIIDNGGLTSEANYPYTAIRGRCQKWKAPVAQISDYQFVPSNEEALLRAVAHQPISTAMFCTHDDFHDYGGGLYSHHHEYY